METATFNCSICGDKSQEICVYCTKDACGNHLCERCHRCSDCCLCDMPVTRALKLHHSLAAPDPDGPAAMHFYSSKPAGPALDRDRE